MRGERFGPAKMCRGPGRRCSVLRAFPLVATMLNFGYSFSMAPTSAPASSCRGLKPWRIATSPTMSKFRCPLLPVLLAAMRSSALMTQLFSAAPPFAPSGFSSGCGSDIARKAAVNLVILAQFRRCLSFTRDFSHSSLPWKTGEPSGAVRGMSKPSSPQMATMYFNSVQLCRPTFLNTDLAAAISAAAAVRSRQATCKMNGSNLSHVTGSFLFGRIRSCHNALGWQPDRQDQHEVASDFSLDVLCSAAPFASTSITSSMKKLLMVSSSIGFTRCAIF
mmetsp:Transcript_49091/g.114827  ORF Transcript_49091/g.114827 Transcript_49091/m.114827 type:complete len:277 (+) Transcript_49091:693-1523(+)